MRIRPSVLGNASSAVTSTAHVFALGRGHAANDAAGILASWPTTADPGRWSTLAAEVGVGEGMVTTQAAKQHGAAVQNGWDRS